MNKLLRYWRQSGVRADVKIWLSFLIIALVFSWPLVMKHTMALGVDSFFHLHRFYDAAMQLKNHDWQYFISLYGFNQSGRIVNAVYGPWFAYFNGLLLLLVKSWLYWQYWINVIIVFTGLGIGYSTLRTVRIRRLYSVVGALLLVSLMPGLSWFTNQAFMNVGALLLPLAVAVGLRMVTNHTQPINVWQMGAVVGFGMQIHMLSTVFMIVILAFYAVPGVLLAGNKLRFLGQGVCAAIVALLLSINVWLPLLTLERQNHLLRPFIEPQADSAANTIGLALNGSRGLSILALILIGLALTLLIYHVANRQKLPFVTWWTLLGGMIFMLMSTPWLPWRNIMADPHNVLSMFQFPLRFAIPGMILIIFGLFLWLNTMTWANHRATELGLVLLGMLAFGPFFMALPDKLATITPQSDMTTLTAQVTQPVKLKDVRMAEQSSDLGELIAIGTQIYPDYLPISDATQQQLSSHDWFHKNGLDEFYRRDIVLHQLPQMHKSVQEGVLHVTWIGKKSQSVTVPVVKYQQTRLKLNGKMLPANQPLSEIGAPIVQQRLGKNELLLWYNKPSWFGLSQLIPVFGWVFLMLLAFVKVGQRMYKN